MMEWKDCDSFACFECGHCNCPEWISVKDMLPKKDKPILVYGEGLDFPISVYWLEDGTYGEPGFFEHGDEYEMKQCKITHWMPLPPAPKEIK